MLVHNASTPVPPPCRSSMTLLSLEDVHSHPLPLKYDTPVSQRRPLPSLKVRSPIRSHRHSPRPTSLHPSPRHPKNDHRNRNLPALLPRQPFRPLIPDNTHHPHLPNRRPRHRWRTRSFLRSITREPGYSRHVHRLGLHGRTPSVFNLSVRLSFLSSHPQNPHLPAYTPH